VLKLADQSANRVYHLAHHRAHLYLWWHAVDEKQSSKNTYRRFNSQSWAIERGSQWWSCWA